MGICLLFEWFSSPIVYLETEFADTFRSIMEDYFSTKRSLYHYISMADGNYREYLKGEMVRAKKYFYVLRPILACRWILDKGTPPPMLFAELMEAELPETLLPEVNRLLNLKINSPEIKEILQSMDEISNIKWSELNFLFMKYAV